MLGRCICLRDVKRLCVRLGFDPPRRTLHAFRHTFSVNYLRKGGLVFHLQKCLGHSSLEMSRRYANLMMEDLQAIHQKISLLAASTRKAKKGYQRPAPVAHTDRSLDPADRSLPDDLNAAI